MNLFLLAAGEGTRFRPHTQILPKPAIPFCGSPLINFAYFFVKPLNPKKLVINTFHLPEKIKEVGLALQTNEVKVIFSDENKTLLGSAGGMAKAESLLKGDGGFMAINADEIIIPQNLNIIEKFYNYSQSSDDLAVLMVMKHPEAGKKFGAVWVDEKGKVAGFGKIPPISKNNSIDFTPYHFIGPMYFKDRIFNHTSEVPSNILHDVLKNAMIEGESVGFFEIECDWFETGNLTDYLHSTEQVLRKIETKNLFMLEFKKEFLRDMELIKTDKALIFKHKCLQLTNIERFRGFAVLGEDITLSGFGILENIIISHGKNIIVDSIRENELIL